MFLCVVRNEALRLPYLLTYYRKLGFDAFLFVDNGSTDGTREFLLAQPDVHLFHTDERFGAPPGAGLPWKNALLDEYCGGGWVLVADADELLVWPGSENQSIQSLTSEFDAQGAEVLFVVMIDFYAKKPFGRIGYKSGAPFINHTPYFDRAPYMLIPANVFPFRQIDGGVRARLYRSHSVGFGPPVMSKVPLLKWRKGQRFIIAQHALQDAMPLASLQGAFLHFKMFDDLVDKCETEARRGEYFAQGREYQLLGTILCNTKTFYDAAASVRYENTGQLKSLGLIGPLAERMGPLRPQSCPI